MAMQALVMGFGGTGAHILTALKELTVLKHGKVPETIKFLLFDTIADWEPGKAVQIVGGAAEEKIAKSEDEAASLDPDTEYFQLADFQPDLKTHVFDYLLAGKPEEYPHLKDWLHAPWLSENVPPHQLAITIGAAQQRQIGRFAMFKNASTIVARLSPIIRRLKEQAAGADVNVWLISSAVGGTGAGCFIDAAYLTRLAASSAGVTNVKLTGVIVLPNVYSGVAGISQARGYSLLRELERVQEQGISANDRYVDRNRQLVSSRVIYDKSEVQTATVKSRLFDDLFYLGSDCPTEEDRKKFFTSVASAIDPYLDESSGPRLLEWAVNDTAAASAFGAARIYVPTETFAQKFAWEQVAEYLRRAAAPQESGDRVVNLSSGSEQDRQDNATSKVKGLLKLFEQLLEQESKPERAREAFVRNELDARQIVTLWYELTGSNRTPQEQAVLLTYVDPFYSFIEADRPADVKEWETKTFKENEQTKGVKEKQEDSKARFADRLEEIKKRYTNMAGGERTFEKGRRYVLNTISEILQKRADALFVEELVRNRTQFAQNASTPDQGTVLTRLYAEVTWMLGDQGPMRKIHEIVGQFVATLAKEAADRNNRYAAGLQALRDSRKSGLGFGVWVEGSQQAARIQSSEYIHWFQKYELLKDMQQMVNNVEKRLKQWESLLGRLFDNLVRRERGRDSEPSALFTVTQIYLKGTLEERLYRAARNRSALISLGKDPDPEMHGFQEQLRSESATGLAETLLRDSHWEAGLTAEGMPELTLVIESDGFDNRRYKGREIRDIVQDLYRYFHRQIDTKLANTDIFKYLLWLQDNRDISTAQVAQLLNTEANALINAGGEPEMRTLVYKEPNGTDKKNLAEAIVGRLKPLAGVETSYSDRNAIILIKIKKPGLDEIVDIQNCWLDYFRLRNAQLAGKERHDNELKRALVFHPFRQEMEAWYIERYYRTKAGTADVRTLRPRVVRLLEYPEMMQHFVHGIVTGAVEYIEDRGWVWHGSNEDVDLTSERENPNADVISAAICFALKQAEGRPDGLKRIAPKDAERSVIKKAEQHNKPLTQLLKEYIPAKLDEFLNKHAPTDLREQLKMVFTFYCDPRIRTGLQHRMNLD
ncbi:MAG TPA: tubulin-like doman-containing protein [Blastocatellia bacterium]|nr:tubulin-like doman-containing protein [Blastocatellia bacterium]